MSEIQRLRMELKTDIELLAIRQGQMANAMEQWSGVFASNGEQIADHGRQIAEQGRQIAEQGRQIAEQGRQIAQQGERIEEMSQHIKANFHETARLGREIAEGQRWTEGRMRLMGERFDAILRAFPEEHPEDHDLLLDLRDRVERLEGERRPPAA